MASASIAVLVSAGANPVSGRPRRAQHDTRALRLAVALARAGEPIDVIHAGDPNEPALREYLGSGAARVQVIAIPTGADPAPVLCEHLQRTRPSVVLTGVRAETGEASGFLPYWLGERLGAIVLPEAVQLEQTPNGVDAVLVAPGARRRKVSVTGPVIATVGPAGPPTGIVAHGPTLRGVIDVIRSVRAEVFNDARTFVPARRRPKRIAAIVHGSQAASGALTGLDAEQAATVIRSFLEIRGFLP